MISGFEDYHRAGNKLIVSERDMKSVRAQGTGSSERFGMEV